MRNVMVTTIGEDYVIAAQAKGLPNRAGHLHLRGPQRAAAPAAGFALALGFVVSGALVMEIVFSYPGIGLLLLNAVTSNDYPLMQAIFLVITFAVLLANLIADMSSWSPIPAPGGGRRRHDRRPADQRRTRGDPPARSRPGRWRRMPAKAKVGAILLGLFVLAGDHRPVRRAVRPVVPEPAPALSLHAPYGAHLLGTTQSGQDVLSQLLVGIRLTLELAFIAGVVATVLSVLVGVTAGFLGGVWDEVLSLLTNVVPGHPRAAAAHRPARLLADTRASPPTDPGAQPPRLAVGRPGDPGADAGPPQPRLRRGGPGDRREDLADHRLRDPAERGQPDRGQLRGHRALRDRRLGGAGLHRRHQPEQLEPGHRSCTGRRASRRCSSGPGGGSSRRGWPSRSSAPAWSCSTSGSTSSATRACATRPAPAGSPGAGSPGRPDARARRRRAAPRPARRLPALVLPQLAA